MVKKNKLTDISIITKAELLDNPIITEEQLKIDKNFFERKQKMWQTVNTYRIEYTSQGHKVIGFVVEPKVEGVYPCIIFNRGGCKDYGKIGERLLFFMMAELASNGYVIVASQYSGNDDGEGKDECGGSDIEDVLILQKILDEYEKADEKRIGMYGGSRGGAMTYLALTKIDYLKCAVIKAGSSNEIRAFELRPELKAFRSDMYDVNDEQELIKRSPVFWADKLTKNTPILLQHGTADDKVTVLDTLDMSIELHKNQIPFQMHIYEGDGHFLSKNKREVFKKTVEWLDRYLK